MLKPMPTAYLFLPCPGKFATDNEVRLLLKTFLANLFDSNPAVRRSAAACLAAACDHSRRPAAFLPWLLAALLVFLVPVSTACDKDGEEKEGAGAAATPSNRILGILTCARLLVPRIASLKEETSGPSEVNLLERMLQLYELCLHYASHRDHNVVSHALETLLQLLKYGPKRLQLNNFMLEISPFSAGHLRAILRSASFLPRAFPDLSYLSSRSNRRGTIPVYLSVAE